MGISAIASYRNSQLFETVGLDAELCDEFFEDAGRALGGKGLHEILQDCIDRHCEALLEKLQTCGLLASIVSATADSSMQIRPKSFAGCIAISSRQRTRITRRSRKWESSATQLLCAIY